MSRNTNNGGMRRNLLEHNRSGSYLGAFSYRKRSEYLGSCRYHNVIADGRMPFHILQALPSSGGKRSQRYSLIDFDVVPDNRGFANDNAGSVINEKILPDDGAGMDIDAGFPMRMLGHDTGNERYAG